MSKKINWYKRLKDETNDQFELIKFDGRKSNTIKHKCGWNFEIKNLNTFLVSPSCPVCDEGNKSLDLNIIKEKLNRKFPNKYEILSTKVDIKSKDKILINDLTCKHEPWLTSWDRLKQENGCPKCGYQSSSLQRKLSKEKIEIKLNNFIYNEYEILNLNEYVDVHSKNLRVKHIKCNSEFLTRGRNLFYNKNLCPTCIKSLGEIIIENYLKENKIDYKIHYREKNLKGVKEKNNLEFDFVFNNIRLEYNGEFHYEQDNFKNNRLNEQLENDKLKEKFAIENNLFFVIIPYWEKENIPYILNEILTNSSTTIENIDITIIKDKKYYQKISRSE